MSKLPLKEILRPVDQKSEKRLNQFLDGLTNLSYFYLGNEFPSIVESILEDQNVDFCILEFENALGGHAENFWNIEAAPIKKKIASNKELNPSGKIFNPDDFYEKPKLISAYHNALIDAILNTKGETKTHMYAYMLEKVNITISNTVLLEIDTRDFDYFDELYFADNVLYKDVLKPFTFLFDMEMEFEESKKTVKKPFLMTFDRDLFNHSHRYRNVKYTYIV